MHTKSLPAISQELVRSNLYLKCWKLESFGKCFLGSGKSDVDVEVKRLVLSYMNGIQAIYLLPSLQQEIDISIVRMEMWTHGDPYNSYQVDGFSLHNICATMYFPPFDVENVVRVTESHC